MELSNPPDSDEVASASVASKPFDSVNSDCILSDISVLLTLTSGSAVIVVWSIAVIGLVVLSVQLTVEKLVTGVLEE